MRAPSFPRAGVLALSALVMGGCAKFPTNGAATNFTRLLFKFKMAAPINPSCVYIVALRALYSDGEDQNLGPIPVADVGSKNGFVAGSPTNFVRYNEALAELYEVDRFSTKAEAPDPSDTNPINLSAYSQTSPVYPTDNVDPRPIANGGATYGDTLGFEVDTRQLTLNDDDAKRMIGVQFNILTMTYPVGQGSTGDRVMDALGNQRGSTFNDYVNLSLRTSRTYYNTDRGSLQETADDTYSINGKTLPPVDIVDWSVEVRTP